MVQFHNYATTHLIGFYYLFERMKKELVGTGDGLSRKVSDYMTKKKKCIQGYTIPRTKKHLAKIFGISVYRMNNIIDLLQHQGAIEKVNTPFFHYSGMTVTIRNKTGYTIIT